MEKQKRWQLYLILAVLILTVYNILPTIFYYTKPLNAPIDQARAEKVAEAAIDRVQQLEPDAVEWLGSFSRLLGVKPASIALKSGDAGIVEVRFNNQKDAELFSHFLPRAGALIPFAPAQLDLYQSGAAELATDPNTVLVSRQIKVSLTPEERQKLFQYTSKYAAGGQIAPLYRQMVEDRAAQMILAFAGTSKTAQQASSIVEHSSDPAFDELTIALAKEIVEIDRSIGKSGGEITKRYYASLFQAEGQSAESLAQKFSAKLGQVKTTLSEQRTEVLEEQKKLKAQGLSLSPAQESRLSLLEKQQKSVEAAAALLKKNNDLFKAAKKPLNRQEVAQFLNNSSQKVRPQLVSLEGRNPFIEALAIDWENDKILLRLYPDLQALRAQPGLSESAAYQKEKLNQLLINEIARASRLSDEAFLPDEHSFSVALNSLINSNSFLLIDLGYLAEKHTKELTEQLQSGWTPENVDLAHTAYPIYAYDQYVKLKPEEKKLGLVIYAPSASQSPVPQGFNPSAVYVIAKGLDLIVQKYQQAPESEASQQFARDLESLKAFMQKNGFIGYPAAAYGMAKEFSKDYIFELNDFYTNLLRATREEFAVKGSKRFGVLDFTNVEQRILTVNKMDDRIQEDLLKWKEEYDQAQVDLNATNKYIMPRPTKNPYWENFKLSFVKYFRGDDRKVLKWGLDLSGGKTVRIGLLDHNNRVVTNPDDLKQAVNELYTRINKMGVAERTIHIENQNIVLDFPGSQAFSAAELVKASAMYFHIVNERFTRGNEVLKDAVDRFLQDVWNEAVVTNRKDIDSINEIAWQHLGAVSADGVETRPRNEYAQQLWENGLRLANPSEKSVSPDFNDTLSSVARMRGEDFMEWDGQPTPLLFVFHNYALEGSSLNNIQVGYDANEGNILSFGVKRSYEGSQEKGSGSPRDDFYAWTAQFAEDKIAGTPKETYTHGRGWRMAVILNGAVVSKPSLRAALRDGGTISGRFSQREINQLASDLKAGSLTFTPKILSEQNVSPELGHEERVKGIVAAVVAVLLVIAAMVAYYKFAGLVASCAVLLNILIMWAVLQNIGFAMTLPAIAGIVLTIGMAVDANVLVFERIREEFAISGRIASAIQAGYRKAFSAIIDSNITTIIAALILIQFDSGPIKGFAVALIIGIVSSMFTSLFMTRYFFAGWVQNPKNKHLTMSHFLGLTKFDFMRQTKKAVIISLVVMALGMFLFIVQRNSMLGMDFTGGYSVVVNLQEKPDLKEDYLKDYRQAVANLLMAKGATSNDFQIRELSHPNQLRVQLGMSMEEPGHPFYHMPAHLEGTFAYSYQSNPRLVWFVDTLQSGGLNIRPAQLEHLDQDWSVMSGQLSESMRNNALIGLSIALLSILIYITLRFEFAFAIGAVVGLVHDVIITLGILAMFHWIGFAVQIDLQVIGAIMTIIGYSLNDTIIVFDRIRENLKMMRKTSFPELINHALNTTLSRTLMTSGTTLLVLLSLVFLGGKSIFGFSLVMTIGVLVGTFSSLFIASPVMLYFHNREAEKTALKLRSS
jgi:SecD/SecF fusion protein